MNRAILSKSCKDARPEQYKLVQNNGGGYRNVVPTKNATNLMGGQKKIK